MADEYLLTWGPLSFLRCGAVWSLDIGPVGIFGVGRLFKFRRIHG